MSREIISLNPFYPNSVFALDGDTAIWFLLAGLACAMLLCTIIAVCITRGRPAMLALGFALTTCLQIPEVAHALLAGLNLEISADQPILAARCASLIFFVGLVNTALVDEYQISLLPGKVLLVAALVSALALLAIPAATTATPLQYSIPLVDVTILFIACKYFIGQPHTVAIIIMALSALTASLARFLLEQEVVNGALSTGQFAIARAWTYWLEANFILVSLLFVLRRQRVIATNKAIQLARRAEKIATIAPFVKASRHDLRAPLSDIIGLAQLIADQPLDREQRNHVVAITTAARNALNNINTIFSYASQTESSADQKSRARAEPFQLQAIIEECSHFYDAEMIDRNPDLVVRLAENIPPVLLGDHEILRQIVLLQLQFFLVEQHCEQLLLDIKFLDNSYLQINFLIPLQPRIAQTIKQQPDSIALSSDLAQRAQGQLQVNSLNDLTWADGGSSPTNTLSVVIKLPATADRKYHVESALESALDKQRVLIVDDSQTARRVICAYLERWGIEVFSAESAAEAKVMILHQAALEKPIDIAIVDYRLPDNNGLGLVAELLSEERLQQLPAIIIMSNSANIIEPERARNYGVHHILEKPVLAETLKLVLLENIYLKQSLKEGLAETLDSGSSSNSAPPHHTTTSAKQVLVVEDDSISASVTTGCLRALGLRFDIATTGQQALALQQDNHYDLVLMDCTLPDQTGFDVARHMRNREMQRPGKDTTHPLLIVALTADDSEGFRQRSASAGMDDHLVKPITLAKLQILTQQNIIKNGPIV